MLKNETVNNWSELITTQGLPNRAQVTPQNFYKSMTQALQQQGYQPKFTLHKNVPNEVIMEFQISNPSHEAQDEIQRIIQKPHGLYIIHYVIRKADRGEAQRKKWLGLLKSATVH